MKWMKENEFMEHSFHTSSSLSTYLRQKNCFIFFLDDSWLVEVMGDSRLSLSKSSTPRIYL